MGSQRDEAETLRAERPRGGVAWTSARVYLPCVICGSAVPLAERTLVVEDPATYECPTCGAAFELRPPD